MAALKSPVILRPSTLAPTPRELITLVRTISQRIARFLERQGMLVRDMEQCYQTLEKDEEK